MSDSNDFQPPTQNPQAVNGNLQQTASGIQQTTDTTTTLNILQQSSTIKLMVSGTTIKNPPLVQTKVNHHWPTLALGLIILVVAAVAIVWFKKLKPRTKSKND